MQRRFLLLRELMLLRFMWLVRFVRLVRLLRERRGVWVFFRVFNKLLFYRM